MMSHWRPPSSHLLLIAGLSGAIVFINASGSERSLRLLDRDLYTIIRGDHPNLLRNLDLSSAPIPIYNLSALNLAGEDLRGLRMDHNSLKKLNLSGSHLEQVEFKCVSMEVVDLSGANLKEARFDYSDCPNTNTTLSIDLNGADLSSSMLIGGIPSHGPDSEPVCEKKLTIQGNLNGARFNNSTLQCIVLINLPPKRALGQASSDSEYSRPEYNGLNFVNSNVNSLTLKMGGFRFSDFYQARLKLLAFDPKQTRLEFSTLANLQCTDDSQFCHLIQTDSAGNRLQPGSHHMPRLSLNLRGSSIRSNLPLPKAGQWPAYLCDSRTRWQAVPANRSLPQSKISRSDGMGTTPASSAAGQSRSTNELKNRTTSSETLFFLIQGPATNGSMCSLPP